MRKLLLLSFLALVCSATQAQFRCAPKTLLTPNAPGTIKVTGKDSTGKWTYFWCPSGTAGQYLLQVHAVLNKYSNTVADPMALAWSIVDAPDLLAAVNSAVAGLAVQPVAGSQEDYEHRVLLRAACLAAARPPAEMLPAVKVSPALCPAAPVQPGPSPDVWRTPAAGNTLYVAAGGRLASKVSGRSAPPNALCNCAAPIAVGTSTYCPLAAGAATEVTLCKKVAP